MRILLTNDDGWDAQGIAALHNAFVPAHEVTVIAPRTQQSGVGHAFTFHAPLCCAPLPAGSGMSGHVVDGTPADCVKFAVGHLLGAKPEAVVSGLNYGENSGTSGFYSGTVAAAREAAFWQIPGFAFSLCEEGWPWMTEWALRCPALFHEILAMSKTTFPDNLNHTFFNINIPGCEPKNCRGVRATRQSLAYFEDRYRHEAVTGDSPHDRYWLHGIKRGVEDSDDFDSRALLNNYVCVTPLHFDATADQTRQHLMTIETRLTETISPHRS